MIEYLDKPGAPVRKSGNVYPIVGNNASISIIGLALLFILHAESLKENISID